MEERRPLKRVEYDELLSFEEAEQRFKDAEAAFNEVKAKYPEQESPGQRIDEEDNARLLECVGVLLPLSSQESVRSESIIEGRETESLSYKVGTMTMDIMVYAARFENSGITLLDNPSGMFDE